MSQTQTPSKSFSDLKQHLNELQDLRSTQALLGWDLETIMPKNGASIRANQMATLTKLSHQKLTSSEIGTLLAALEQESLSGADLALVKETRREYDRAVKLPGALLEKFVQVTAEAHHVWVDARSQKQFSKFAPVLSKIIDINRQIADIVGFEDSPYNALMDEYEPGLTVKQLNPLFETLKNQLVPLLQKIQAAGKQPDTSFLNQVYETQKQLDFSRYILEEMGFDFDAGRLDLSAHPFTSGAGYADVRLTTRVNETDLFSALSSSMHEGGHGMYEQGIDPALARTLLGDGTSLGIHESQSRLWENVIGRGKAFWTYYFPKIQQCFKPQLDNVSLDQFYQAINCVTPSFIRVEADEVTYNLHILIRYEIERAVIEGTLKVNDIPAAWNEKYTSYLGITPPDDSLGCLQDVHWSHGSFGYFPTYTLGNLYSAQFYAQAKTDHPDLETKIAAGDLKTLKNWLNQKIHQFGRSKTAAEIVQHVCNEPLNSQYFTDYLTAKYTPLYGL